MFAWCDLFDNRCLGWVVDESSTAEPKPVTVGSLPPAAPDTAPVLSPQWVEVHGGHTFVPDQFRGGPFELFDWLATNNGAARQIGGAGLRDGGLTNEFNRWADQHPDLVRSRP